MQYSVACLLLAAALLTGAPAGMAQEPKDVLVREILALSDSTQMFDKMFAQMREPLIDKIRQKDPEKALQTDRALGNQVSEIKTQMLAEITPLFAASFSEQELTQIREFTRIQAAFLQTETGRKMNAIMSPSNTQVMEIASKHVQRLMALFAAVSASAP